MADKSGHTILLKKTSEGWTATDEKNDKYPVKKSPMRILLKTIKSIEVKHPVPKAAYDHIIAQLATKHTKVEIYDNKDNLIKCYYVGEAASNYLGSYMILEDADNPYVVHIPGFDGYMSGRYFLDVSKWRDAKIFALQPNEIQSINIKYITDPQHSFLINVLERDSFEVKRSANHPIPLKNINKHRLAIYLHSFKNIHAENYENDAPYKDSILSALPYCIMTVMDKNHHKNAITIYRMPLNRRSKLQYDKEGKKMPFDLDRYYALINDEKDFVTIQHFVFGKLLKTYDYFDQDLIGLK